MSPISAFNLGVIIGVVVASACWAYWMRRLKEDALKAIRDVVKGRGVPR